MHSEASFRIRVKFGINWEEAIFNLFLWKYDSFSSNSRPTHSEPLPHTHTYNHMHIEFCSVHQEPSGHLYKQALSICVYISMALIQWNNFCRLQLNTGQKWCAQLPTRHFEPVHIKLQSVLLFTFLWLCLIQDFFVVLYQFPLWQHFSTVLLSKRSALHQHTKFWIATSRLLLSNGLTPNIVQINQLGIFLLQHSSILKVACVLGWGTTLWNAPIS